MAQSQGHGVEAPLAKILEGVVDPRPGDQKGGAHRHAYASAVEGVAAVAGEQYAIHAECRRGAKHRPDIRRVAHAVDDHQPARLCAEVVERGQRGAVHGAEHAARERVARHVGQQLAWTRVDGDVAQACHDVGSVAAQVSFLAQQCHGLEPGTQRGADDFRALHDHEGFCGMQTVAKLRVSEFPKHLSARGVLMGDVYDRHKSVILSGGSGKDEDEYL